jgi:hypothetical protein
MNRLPALALLPLSLCLSMPSHAQDSPKISPEEAAMMEAYQKAGTPSVAHAGLAATVGDYSVLIKSWSAPGAAPSESTGTASRKLMLGGRVVSEELQSSMYGQPYTGFGLTGFDNVTGKYWTTWNDSMTTGLTTGTGTCDAQARCTFSAHWDDPVSKQPATARISIRWTSPSVEIFEMFGPGPDGKEMKMMEMTYTRK